MTTNDAYKIAYRTITSDAGKSERALAFGENDIGQHSWTTPAELTAMIEACELSPHSRVVDIGCGAGGPAMFVAEQAGCQVSGLDIDEQGINSANALAGERGLSNRCRFQQHDAVQTFDLPAAGFDLVFAIDSVFHIPQREHLLLEIKRILDHDGYLFFTDAGIVNGQISGDEFELRSYNGTAFYAPIGYNSEILEKTGFELIESEDLTSNNEEIARNRFDARVDLQTSLIATEGESEYHGRQAYLHKVAELCRQRRLCRYSYLARKTR